MSFLHLIFRVLVAVGFTLGVRPDDLVPEKGCELWVGTMQGNDPSVQVQLTLCENPEDKNDVNGVLQWSSEKSGWNKRAVEGRYSGEPRNELLLHDTKFLENKPNLPWMFCLIDEYRLELSGTSLKGAYRSKKCKDVATVILDLKETK